MANVIIPPWHQSAPEVRYDPKLAHEAAEQRDRGKFLRTDWDAIDWEAANPASQRASQSASERRRAMVNQDFDLEMASSGHRDASIVQLEAQAYREWIELRPELWVEQNLELEERNRMLAARNKLEGQERWEGAENERQRLVNVMHPNEVMRRLRRAGVDARTEEHPQARIWLNDWSAQGLVGVNAWVKPQEMEEEGYLLSLASATTERQRELLTENFHACRERRRVRKTLTSLQEPYGPEWSVMRIDKRGVATREKYRGWRTAMLVLITAEVLTEEEVERAFGPAIGEAGAWYRRQLQVLRRIRAMG